MVGLISKGLKVTVFAGFLSAVLLIGSLPVEAKDRIESFDFVLFSGYRTGEFDWNIAKDLSGSVTPNILSELVWEDLEIFLFGGASELRIANDRVPFLGLIAGSATYGDIFSGNNRDSDYDGDNRTMEFSRSVNDAGDGELWDLSIAAGPEFVFFRNKLGLSPLLGYSYHEQNLTLSDGVQVIPPTGAFAGLDSSYNAVWKGGWLGGNVRFVPFASFSVSARCEYHLLTDYEGVGNWNLRQDLQNPVSFRHDIDDAEGLVAQLGGELAVSDRVRFTMDLSYQKWWGEDGIDTIYSSSGSVGKTRLNEVNWESVGLMVGLKAVY